MHRITRIFIPSRGTHFSHCHHFPISSWKPTGLLYNWYIYGSFSRGEATTERNWTHIWKEKDGRFINSLVRCRWSIAVQAGRSRVRFQMGSLEFFIILTATLWPWGRLSLWQKWVQGICPGGKGGRCLWLTNLPPSYDDCLEIWEPQPPGALRACPGL